MIWLVITSCLAVSAPRCEEEPKILGWPVVAARDVPDCAASAKDEIEFRRGLFDGRRIIEWRCEERRIGEASR